MPNNDNDKIKDKNPSGFNEKAYRHAISMIESSGGKFLETGINPKTGRHYSSAAGKYHFLYESIKGDPEMKGISKREFMNDDALQERIMDKALAGKLKGYTYGEGYANKLKKEFNSNYDVNGLMALVHFVGAGNAREFLKDPQGFRVPGAKNLTGDQYLEKFKKYFKEFNTNNPTDKEASKYSSPERINDERRHAVIQQDNTAVRQPITNKNRPSIIPSSLKGSTSAGYDFIDSSNSFKKGGQMDGLSGAEKLVTMFEGGGSHEQNPNGGIPQGVGANGKPNLVEEGETKWNDYIFSNAIDMDGNFTGEDGNKINVFENGGKLDGKKKGETKGKVIDRGSEIKQSKPLTSIMRNMLPIPQNAAQLAASLANEDSTYTTKDGGAKANEHLYRSVRNAVKRTGKNKGGTEYVDYSPQIDKDLNSLRMNAADMALGSALSPELEAATTYGRVSYDVDPKTGAVKIYDTYDFNKTPGGSGAYSKIRSAAGEASEGKLDSTPKLIGEFNMNDNPDDVGFKDIVSNILNPIDALDINYSSIKKATNKASDIGNKIYNEASKVGDEIYKKGKNFLNSFEDGGELTTGGKEKEKVESGTDPAKEFGPQGTEGDKYPLKFTKTQSVFHKKGRDIEVNDIRDKYIGNQIPFTPIENDRVNFERTVKDEQGQSFLDRYNNDWSREKMQEQTGLTNYDIDNMILRGLEAEKEVGNNVRGSKASYDHDDHKISMGVEHKDDAGVETHERVHASGFDAAQGKNLLNTLGSAFQQEGRSFLKKMSPDTLRYLGQPHEAYGNFVEFREKLGLKPGEKISPEELKAKVKKKGLGMENFYRAFNDENISKALNTIAYQDSTETEDTYRLS